MIRFDSNEERALREGAASEPGFKWKMTIKIACACVFVVTFIQLSGMLLH